MRDDKSIELNFSGEVNDGISSIVSSNRFKSGTALGVKYHKLIGKKAIQLNFDDVNEVKVRLGNLKSQEDLLKLKYEAQSEVLKKEFIKKGEIVENLKKKKLLLLFAKEKHLQSGNKKNISIDKDNGFYLRYQREIIENELKIIENDLKEIEKLKALKMKALKSKKSSDLKSKNFNKYKFNVDSINVLNLPYKLKKALTAKRKDLKKTQTLIAENTFNQDKLDSIELLLKIAEEELKAAKDKYNQHENGWVLGSKQKEIIAKRRKAVDDYKKLRARSVELGWITIGGGLLSETYNLFDPSLLGSQSYKEKDLVPSVSISYSKFNNNKERIVNASKARKVEFFTVGGKIKYGNNINTLSKVELEMRDTISGGQFLLDTKTVFKGAFEDNIVVGQLYIDYYSFGFYRKNVGFHLNGTVDFGAHSPIYSIKGGVLFNTLNKERDKPNVNFEFFYSLRDLFKDDGEGEVLNRNILGVQATFPIKLI